MNLIFADYQLHVNQKPQTKEGLKTKSLRTVIEEVFAETSLAERLEMVMSADYTSENDDGWDS